MPDLLLLPLLSSPLLSVFLAPLADYLPLYTARKSLIQLPPPRPSKNCRVSTGCLSLTDLAPVFSYLFLFQASAFNLSFFLLVPFFLPAFHSSMSERGSFRGGRGGRGGRPQQKSGGGGGAQEKPKKENILDLGKYMDKEVQVKFNGGREGE